MMSAATPYGRTHLLIHGISYTGTATWRRRSVTLFSLGNPFSDGKSIDIAYEAYAEVDSERDPMLIPMSTQVAIA